jgi:group II intron reverse transcriptase/maturase
MTYEAFNRLYVLQRLNSDNGWVNRDLYRLLYRPELYVLAYERMKSKAGNMTEGTDGLTLDGMSLDTIEGIINEIKDESYQPSPARRVYIPKSNGKLRPLGIPSTRDKIVQEAVRTILDCIYDSPQGPTFTTESHGFREGRSTHTALEQVCKTWGGTKWFIEGDIKSFFDEIDHDVLIQLLSKRIKDDRFINLIRKFLNAGYIEEDRLLPTTMGTPQGGIISPLLANVYLHEYDLWVNNLAKSYNKGTKRKANKEYRSVVRKRSYLLNKCKGKPDAEQAKRLKVLEERIKELPSVDTHDPDYVRVRYVRYADDWLIGVTGPKALAQEIKSKVADFFKDSLKLTLSPEKTKITHTQDRADFLGYLVGTPVYGEPQKQKFKGGQSEHHTVRRSSTSNAMRLWAPKDRLLAKLAEERFIKFKNHKPFALSKRSYVHLDPDEIVRRYNAIKRGLFNYYKPVMNLSVLRHIDYLLRLSLAKTLAHKYRTSMKQQFQKRGKSLTVKKEVKGQIWTVSYWEQDLQRNMFAFSTNPRELDSLFVRFQKTTKSKLGLPCCICGSESSDMHHLRHLRKGGKTVVKGFNRIMARINRKQIPVCKPCHVAIHNGEYDGMSLKELHYDPSYL